jgi:putative Holliday junction resolvase
MADSPKTRVLALDVGASRIGLAISDPLGITAQGLDTLRRSSKRADLEHLAAMIREHDVREIVVGHPLRLSGSASAQTEKVEQFAEDLRRRFQLPVHLWDERLTSAQAQRVLRESGISIRKRGQAVDRMAAVLILQQFLDSRQSGFSRQSSVVGRQE